MPIQNIGGQVRDGNPPGNSGGQQTSQVEAAAAGPSSSTGSARHNGHTKAREHDASYQPQRQAEQYTAGGL
jgi:hypothetical protein